MANMSHLEEGEGKKLHQWEFQEYIKHSRGPLWFVAAFFVAGGLLLYAIQDKNFLFAVIIILTLFILFMTHRREPLKLFITISSKGVKVGNDFYTYKDLDRFAIIYEPPLIKQLYLHPKNGLLTREMSIPLENQNPLKIRATLLDYVVEDLERENESTHETVTRLLKF